MSKFILRPGINLTSMLKAKGYSSYRIAHEKLFCSGAMQKFRDGKLPSWGELAKLVSLLRVSPVNLIAYQNDDGVIIDLTGHRIEAPAPQHPTIGHHPPMDDLPEDFWTGSQGDNQEDF